MAEIHRIPGKITVGEWRSTEEFHSMWICRNGIKRWFQIPEGIKFVDFVLYDKPVESSFEIKLSSLTGDVLIRSGHQWFDESMTYNLALFLLATLPNHRKVYVQAEY